MVQVLVLVDNRQTPIWEGYPADAGDPVMRSYGSRRLNTSTDVASTRNVFLVFGYFVYFNVVTLM